MSKLCALCGKPARTGNRGRDLVRMPGTRAWTPTRNFNVATDLFHAHHVVTLSDKDRRLFGLPSTLETITIQELIDLTDTL